METAPDDAGLKHLPFMGLDIFLAYLSGIYIYNVDAHCDQARNASDILLQSKTTFYFHVFCCLI